MRYASSTHRSRMVCRTRSLVMETGTRGTVANSVVPSIEVIVRVAIVRVAIVSFEVTQSEGIERKCSAKGVIVVVMIIILLIVLAANMDLLKGGNKLQGLASGEGEAGRVGRIRI
jgi:hypothetical protein